MVQVNRLIQEEVAGILLSDMQDERLHTITVIEVRTTRDLRHAIVFITAHTKEQKEEILKAVNHSAKMIRKLVGSRIHLKRTPELDFRYDESLDRAERIYAKLEEVEEDLEEVEEDILE